MDTRKLIKDANAKLNNGMEYQTRTLKGVKNLSVSDLETAILYAETYERDGHLRSLMKPRGEVGELLSKYGYTPA